MIKKIFIVLLLALVFIAPALAGTDKYNDGSWRITSDGDLLPVGSVSVVIGSGTSYPTSIRLNAISKTAWVTTTAIAPGATVSVNLSVADLFTLTPTNAQHETITFTGATTIPGHRAAIVITSTLATQEVITFSDTNCKHTGTMVISATNGKVRTVEFQSDGTNWNEISRTGDM